MYLVKFEADHECFQMEVKEVYKELILFYVS